VARAWRLIVAGGGRTPIGDLAREVGWSHRHLIARFRQQVGLTPKTAARLVRFEALLARLRERPASWARLAAEAGYADQAHLVRDFRSFTGRTPTTYVSPW
jgi:transcriptional regulator GlxA family with amidase domain